jgi:hypothetical protein
MTRIWSGRPSGNLSRRLRAVTDIPGEDPALFFSTAVNAVLNARLGSNHDEALDASCGLRFLGT